MEFLSEFTVTDLVVLLTLAGGVLIGFQQGLLRYILNALVVLVAFVLASQLKGPIASGLRTVWTLGTPEQQELWVYLLLLALGIIGGFVLVRMFYRETRLPIVRQLDEILGAVVAVLWVALLYTFTLIVLDSFFEVASESSVAAATVLGPFYEFLNQSVILAWFREWLMPIVGFVVGPFVPHEIDQFLN